MNLSFKSAVFLCVAVPFAYAQETSGTISGSVLDASGAGVPGVSVSITALDRNVELRKVKTDTIGNYSAPLLPVGKYSVSVEAKGFKKAVQKDIVLNAGDSLTIGITAASGRCR